MAGLYHGHLLEFPYIRVDCFTSPPLRGKWLLPQPSANGPPRVAPAAQLYLLTHVHSDHLTGLGDNFIGKIVCSPDTKRLLLRLEYERDRAHLHHGSKEIRKLKFEGFLRSGGADRIVTLNPGESRVFDYCVGKVCITLLNANHCPGSSMFLVTSETNAILHTGDVRASTSFLQGLQTIPCLQEFMASSTTTHTGKYATRRRQLDRIYLDTSAILGTGDMPESKPVLEALMAHMSFYPTDTVFFLNTWCLGWEDVIKEVAKSFQTRVHVDRYKRTLFAAIHSDPNLLESTTDDYTTTRFHACDRFFRCAGCKAPQIPGNHPASSVKLRVQIDMVEVKSTSWDLQYEHFLALLNQAALGEGEWPTTILVPLARHSPLPELQELVKLFSPASLSPNTVVPGNNGLEYLLFPQFFEDGLTKDALRIVAAERDRFFGLNFAPHQRQQESGQKPLATDSPPFYQSNTAIHENEGPRTLVDSRESWREYQLRRFTEGEGRESTLKRPTYLIPATPELKTAQSPDPLCFVDSFPGSTERTLATSLPPEPQHVEAFRSGPLPLSTPRREERRKRKPSAFKVDIAHLRRLAQAHPPRNRDPAP